MSGAREIMERRFIRIRCGTSPREKNAVQSGGRAPTTRGADDDIKSSSP